MTILNKTCSQCKELKPVEDFSKGGPARKDGLQVYCKSCCRANFARGAEKYKKRTRERKYGLSAKDERRMWEDQGGLCVICEDPLDTTYGTRGNIIDHNHATGQVRGILCKHCNMGLGRFKDRKDLLLSAVQYLEERGSYGGSA